MECINGVKYNIVLFEYTEELCICESDVVSTGRWTLASDEGHNTAGNHPVAWLEDAP